MPKDKPGKQPSNDLTGVQESQQPPSTGVPVGPPIDDTVCVPKPPAQGLWKLLSTNGVVDQPPTWIQQ